MRLMAALRVMGRGPDAAHSEVRDGGQSASVPTITSTMRKVGTALRAFPHHAMLRPRRERSYTSSRASSNGSSPAARRFFFERCQTTPGNPFSGTSGSPV